MKKILICGYGGIGKALATAMLDRGYQVMVISSKPQLAHDDIQFITMDLSKFADNSKLEQLLLISLPDIIVNTIGLLHSSQCAPEKNIQQINAHCLHASFDVQLIPTINIAQSLSRVLKPSSQLRMVVLSARVGSITDNKLGGWYSYRMSKAALNMLMRNLSLEWSRQYPHSVIASYHPGTVDTPLSQPFQKNVPKEQLFTPNKAAAYLVNLLEQLTPEMSGGFYDWRGDTIEF